MKLTRNNLIVIGMVVATIIAFFLVQKFFSGPDSAGGKSDVTVESLNREILELESNILELELVFKDQDMDLQEKTRLLEEKYVQLDFMAKKIDGLKRQSRVDKGKIQDLEEKLAEIRGTLLDQYNAEYNKLNSERSHMEQLVDSMALTMNERDSSNMALTLQLESLRAAYRDCADGKPSSVAVLPQDDPTGNPDVTAVVDGKPVFRAYDFRLFNVKSSKREISLNLQSIEAKKLNRIKINFMLSGNEFVTTGKRRVYLVIQNLNRLKKPYSNNKTSGTFQFKGENTLYSSMGWVEYEGKTLDVSIPFDADNEPFTNGPHAIKVYTDDEMIANKMVIFK